MSSNSWEQMDDVEIIIDILKIEKEVVHLKLTMVHVETGTILHNKAFSMENGSNILIGNLWLNEDETLNTKVLYKEVV